MAIVTICHQGKDEVLRIASEGNHQLYATLHGYDHHFFTEASQILPNPAGMMNLNDGVHSSKPSSWKLNAVRNVLDGPVHYEWVLWTDCDAFFMDPLRTLDSVIEMHAANRTAAAVLPREGNFNAPPEEQKLRSALYPDERDLNAVPEVSLILTVDSTGVNSGVWLLRNSQWSRDFLDQWWHSEILQGNAEAENHNFGDRTTMQYQLLYANSMRIDQAWDRSEGPIWPREVRIAAQEHLLSYHSGAAFTWLSREWQEGDFMKHHAGCHYSKPDCQQMFVEAHDLFRDKVKLLIEQMRQMGLLQ